MNHKISKYRNVLSSQSSTRLQTCAEEHKIFHNVQFFHGKNSFSSDFTRKNFNSTNPNSSTCFSGAGSTIELFINIYSSFILMAGEVYLNSDLKIHQDYTQNTKICHSGIKKRGFEWWKNLKLDDYLRCSCSEVVKIRTKFYRSWMVSGP